MITCSIIITARSSRRSGDLYSIVHKRRRLKVSLRYSSYCPPLFRCIAFCKCSTAASILSPSSSIRAISIWTWQRNKINMLRNTNLNITVITRQTKTLKITQKWNSIIKSDSSMKIDIPFLTYLPPPFSLPCLFNEIT